MPAPNARVSFSVGVEALKRMDEQRQAREDRMRNALEILADYHEGYRNGRTMSDTFVRATAREGLGRE